MGKSQKSSEESSGLTTKKESTEMTAYDASAWESKDKFRSNKDLVISRILPMQGMSKLVTAGKAKFGDIFDSVTEEKLGDLDSPVEFIPIRWDLVWVKFKNVAAANATKKKWDWDGMEMITAQNDDLPYEDGDVRRDRTLMFYGLRPDDIKGIPTIVSFRRTSLRGGKKLQGLMEDRLKGAGLPPCAKVVKLKVEKKENDDGTYLVLDYELGRDSTKNEIDRCFEWFQKLKKMEGIKVDNSEFETETRSEEKVDLSQQTEY